MARVIGVRFRDNGKIYYFASEQFEVEVGQNVIVETARGVEYGRVVLGNREIHDEKIIATLKPVIRIATPEDNKIQENNKEKSKEAYKICIEKIKKHKLAMKLIDCEYTFDNNKVLFYFTADGRVDFRELVKDLAAVFKMRIELRQIGVRDEAKMMGGIGACGRSLCCNSWLSGFEPVSIKMAKVQNLSLNPSKISGICGRLMCCLKYENSTYMELRRGMPDVGERIKTRDGIAVVVESNILENKIKTRLVVEEKQGDRPEKLSTEYYTYKKQEIKRLEKGHKPKKEDLFEGLDGELLEEIKDLLKD